MREDILEVVHKRPDVMSPADQNKCKGPRDDFAL